jgi:homogentisate phytyltransferase/homogentisate geranylgeranyltransferase
VNRAAIAVPRRQAGGLDALWRFSRPHTVIGTAVSIVGLYLIAVDTLPGLGLGDGAGDLFWTLVAGLAVNVYIVGINQLEDVDIDRVNKPYLPLAAGDMTRERARAVVGATAGLAVVLALSQGVVETVAVLAGLAVGTAYSMPPLRLKRYPAVASLCISGVRAVVVNVGVYAHFSMSLGDGGVAIPAPVWALTLFVLPFSLAIAILKDVPDAEGDRRFRVMTFTVRLGGRPVMRAGLAALILAYLGMAIAGPFVLESAHPAVLVLGHLAALGLLLAWSRGVDPADPAGFTRFYMRVWKLFFLEYPLVALACLAG